LARAMIAPSKYPLSYQYAMINSILAYIYASILAFMTSRPVIWLFFLESCSKMSKNEPS
jgi:hypothetical protein